MDLEKTVVDLQKAFAAAEEQHRTIFRRLDKSEKLAESVSELALSVRDLVNAQTNTDKKVTTLCKDVAEIKAKPAKRWESVTADVIKLIVAALVGYLLSRVGLG